MTQNLIISSVNFAEAMRTKIISTGIIGLLTVVALAVLMPVSVAFAQAPAQTIIDRTIFEPYVARDAGYLKHRVSYDIKTAVKVCNLMGYATGQSEKRVMWDSISGNTAARWDGAFWQQKTGTRNGYMSKLRCSGTLETISVSCSVNDSSVNVGDPVTFTASASGGNGQISYVWSGSEGLSGSLSTVTKIYNSTGTKTATVKAIGSGGQYKTAQCSVRVSSNTDDDDDNDDDEDEDDDYEGPLRGSCDANRSWVYVDDEVTFRASASGGDGHYTYSWDGSEDLSGRNRSVTHEYDRPGYKIATVTIRSDGRSIKRDCNIVVYEEYAYTYPNYTTPSYNYPTYTNSTYVYPNYTTPVVNNTNGAILTYDQTGPTNVNLGQLPYTGLTKTTKMLLFATGLIGWSMIVAYIFIIRPRLQTSQD